MYFLHIILTLLINLDTCFYTTLPGYILPCQTTMAPYHTQGDTESIYPTTLY